MPDPELTTFLRIMRRAIDEYLDEVGHATPAMQASEPRAPTSPSSNGMGGGVATVTASGTAPDGAASRFDDVRAIMMRQVVDRTGYPEEMLDLDLDLEGELGIDTVKQVAVLGAVREHFGLELDPAFKLRDQNTLRKAITYIARRMEGAAI